MQEMLFGDSVGEAVLRRSFGIMHKHWNGSVKLSLGGSAVPQVQYNASEADSFFPQLLEGYVPRVVKGAPVLKWPAFLRWSDKEYFISLFDSSTIKAHTPNSPIVRVHHEKQPFEEHAQWTRPFVEQNIRVADILNGDKLVYAFLPLRKYPNMFRDVRAQTVTIPW